MWERKAQESRPRTSANSTGREAGSSCFQKWTGQEEPGLLRPLGKQIQPLKVVDINTDLGDSDTLDPAMPEAQKVINAQ